MSPVSVRQRALCWGQMLGTTLKALEKAKAAWSDCGHNQVGVGLKAFWKNINDNRVTEKELRRESWGPGQGREDVTTLCPSAHIQT